MRRPVDASRIEEFLRVLGSRFTHPGRVYLVGGATVVLKGLRAQTLDIVLAYRIDPPHAGEFIGVVRDLKESLDVNVEEVSPAVFIPLLEGHESRALYVGRCGLLEWPELARCFSDVLTRYGRESLKQDEKKFRAHFDVLRGEFG